MKNLLPGLLLGLVLSGILAFTAMKSESNYHKKAEIIMQPEKDLSLARTQKMSGKYVFMNCEPVCDYDVAFEIKGFTMRDFKSPNDMANFVVKNAFRISKKENIDFDGVVVGSGKIDVAIKFK